MGAPWFKVYSKELLSDPKVKQLSHDQLGKLLLLWAFANEDECRIPAEPEAIGRLLGITNRNQMVNQMVWIRRFFAPVGGDETMLVSRRLSDERMAYEEKCAKLRSNGMRGGRPRKPDAKPNGYPNGLADGNQTITEVGSRKEEKETTPLPPKGGRKRREPKPEPVDSLGQPIPVEFVEAVGRIVDACPGEDRDGRKIRVTRGDVLTRLMEIRKTHPAVTLEILVQAWLDYLASQPAHIKAPQYFFGKAEDQGPNAANWMPYARAVYVRMQLEHEPQEIPA